MASADTKVEKNLSPLDTNWNKSGKAGAGVEPARQHRPVRQGRGFPGQVQEHALADILGQKLVASGPTQGRSVNKIQMPSHKFGKSGL